MPPFLAGPIARIRSVLSPMSVGQKVVIALLSVGLVLGGFFFYRWITAPTYAPLFSNLSATDASAIVDQLNSSGVSYQLADGGQTIMVPKDQVYNMNYQPPPDQEALGKQLVEKYAVHTTQLANCYVCHR